MEGKRSGGRTAGARQYELGPVAAAIDDVREHQRLRYRLVRTDSGKCGQEEIAAPVDERAQGQSRRRRRSRNVQYAGKPPEKAR